MRMLGRRRVSPAGRSRPRAPAHRWGAVLAGAVTRRRAGAATAAVVALPLVLVAVLGEGNSPRVLTMTAGAAWVASPAAGVVSLVDGPSGVIAASVTVPATTSGVTVEQAGSSAYVVDGAAGTVLRIDGADWRTTPPTRLGVPGGELAVLQGGGEVYVLDSSRRTVSLVDPDTLERRHRAPLGAAPGPGEAVVDERGRLWVVDGEAGGLSRFDGDLHVERDAVEAGDRLVLVDGRPVLVDASEGSITPVTDAGTAGEPSCLRIRDEDDVRLVGASTGGLVIAAVQATGTLVWGSVGRDDCGHVVSLVEPGTPVDLGVPVHRGDFALVPNRATGETIVVNLAEETVTRLPLTPPGNALELVAKGRLVFYNDLDGHTTGVLRFEDGTWVAGEALQKFDPETREVTAQVESGGGEEPRPRGEGQGPPGGDASVPPRAEPDGDGTPAPGRGPRASGGGAPRAGADGSGPGGRPGPRPTTPATGSPGQVAPTVVRLVPDVEPVPPGSTLTVTGEVQDAQDATWTWSVTGATDWSGTPGQVRIQVPADASGTIDVRLVVRGPGGESSGDRAVQVRSRATVQATCTPVDAGLGQSVVCTGAVDGEAADTWTWRTSGPDGEQTHELPAGDQLTWVPGVTPGAYDVTLTAQAGPAPVEASATGTVTDLCTIVADSAPVDVRHRVQRGTVQPRFEGCWIEAHATPTYTLPDWIDEVFTGVTLYGDERGQGHATIDFLRAGTSTVDGLNADAVTMTLPNGRTAVHDALGNRPPSVRADYACEVTGTNARFVVKAEDADIPSLTATLRMGSYTAPMTPFTHGSAGWFEAVVPRADLPASETTWVATVSDGYDEAGAGNGRGPC